MCMVLMWRMNITFQLVVCHTFMKVTCFLNNTQKRDWICAFENLPTSLNLWHFHFFSSSTFILHKWIFDDVALSIGKRDWIQNLLLLSKLIYIMTNKCYTLRMTIAIKWLCCLSLAVIKIINIFDLKIKSMLSMISLFKIFEKFLSKKLKPSQ